MEKPTRFYYEVKDENKIYYLDENTGEFGSCLTYKKDLKYKYFHLFKEDEQSNEGLILFKDKFNKWCNELNKHGIVYKLTFNRFSSSSTALKNRFEDVSLDEFLFAEDCFNGGLIYLNPKYKDTTTQSFGYDYSSFYPNILVSDKLKIPTKQGQKLKLNHLDFTNLQYGIYKVRITCDNKEFLKIFAFSKKNTYTHFGLEFAYKYKDIFDVKIELITDIDFNALVYRPETLINSRDIFYNWFDKLYKIKPSCKDNQLLKRLLSSLWGSLTKCEKYYFNDEQDEGIPDEKIGTYMTLDEKYYYIDGELLTRFECVKKSKPYKYHYGRMKAFLLSLGRNIIGELIMNAEILQNVVRINTDGIVLNQEFDFPSLKIPYYPKPEDKTTGLIQWNNVNNYFKVDS